MLINRVGRTPSSPCPPKEVPIYDAMIRRAVDLLESGTLLDAAKSPIWLAKQSLYALRPCDGY
jgi:hypothetical protein